MLLQFLWEFVLAEKDRISEWIERVKSGPDAEAENGLYTQFFLKLEAVASKKLNNRHDGESVAQSVMKTFFRRIREGLFPDFDDQTDLRKLLLKTAHFKINNFRRHQFAEKRDVRRSVSLEWIQETSPTMELADKFYDECNDLLESLTDERDRTVAVLKLEGCTNAEIAEKTNRSTKTVEWRLRKIRKRIEEAGID